MKPWNFEKYFNSEHWRNFFLSPRSIGGRVRKLFRIVIGSLKGFTDDECSDKASALTFYTLLSIVPVLAVAFGIAKGFGFEKKLEVEIIERFKDQPEIASQLIHFSTNMLNNAQSGLIAGVGLAVLLWSVVKLMSNIEYSFNAIWKVKTSRSWPRRISDYLAMMLFCPIFFVISSSITVYFTGQIHQLSEAGETWKTFGSLILLFFQLFPLFLSWMLFTALYYIMPNAKVPLSYAMIAGAVSGTVYQIMQWIYIQFAIGLASYGAIYGSFAALPLFLLWLNTSWLIALAGAEIAYHAENDMSLTYRSTVQKYVEGRVLAIILMKLVVNTFQKGARPLSVYDLAHSTGIAVISVKQIMQKLINGGLIVEVSWKDGTSGYVQPAKAISNISLLDICRSMDDSREKHYLINYSDSVETIIQDLNALDLELANSPKNIPIDTLL